MSNGDQKVLNHVLLDDNDVRGVEVVNDSFSETKDGRTIKESWREKLRIHQRLQPFRGTQPPTVAFSHLVFGDGTAAVLRRVHRDGDAGRNLTHALVGIAEPLADLALQLTRWNGWRDRAEKHQSIAADLLVNVQAFGHQHDDRLRLVAMHDDIEMALLLAAVLERPELPNTFSVIGVPDPQIVPMLWGIRDIVRVIANGTDRDRWWSFSTYETSDADRENLPEFVFLPAYPSGIQAQSYRRRVDYTPDAAPQLDRGYLDLAKALVFRYRSFGPDDLRDGISHITRSEPDLAARIRALALELVGTDLQPRNTIEHRLGLDADEIETGGQEANGTATAPVDGWFDDGSSAAEGDASVTAPEHSIHKPDGPDSAVDLSRSGLLDQLTAMRTAEDLAQLTHRIQTEGTDARLAENGQQLIAWLALVDQRVIDILRTELPLRQQVEEFTTLLDLVFGLPGSVFVAGSVTQPVIDWLARTDVPRVLVQLVYERVCGASLGEVGKQALGDRWLAEQQRLPTPPASWPYPVVAPPPSSAPAPVPKPSTTPVFQGGTVDTQPKKLEHARSKQQLGGRIRQTAAHVPLWFLVLISLLMFIAGLLLGLFLAGVVV